VVTVETFDKHGVEHSFFFSWGLRLKYVPL
jgi:hypothetical protein